MPLVTLQDPHRDATLRPGRALGESPEENTKLRKQFAGAFSEAGVLPYWSVTNGDGDGEVMQHHDAQARRQLLVVGGVHELDNPPPFLRVLHLGKDTIAHKVVFTPAILGDNFVIASEICAFAAIPGNGRQGPMSRVCSLTSLEAELYRNTGQLPDHECHPHIGRVVAQQRVANGKATWASDAHLAIVTPVVATPAADGDGDAPWRLRLRRSGLGRGGPIVFQLTR